MGSGVQLELVRATITGNDANGVGFAGVGGGLRIESDATVSVVDSTIAGNRALNSGGIHAGSNTTIEIIRSTLKDNKDNRVSIRGTNGGQEGGAFGGLFAVDSSITIDSSTIAGNSAEFGGGGITAANSRLVITNSTIAGNSSGPSGAILASGEVMLSNSTVTGNYSRYDEYAASIYLDSGTRFHVDNSIVAGNYGYFGRRSNIGGTVTSSNGHNIFGSDVRGNAPGDVENVSSRLLFAEIDPDTRGGQLALNGGPTSTVALCNDPRNPALAGADPDDAPGVDQRGQARPLPAGTDPDIGAFELNQRGGVGDGNRPTRGDDILTGTAGSDRISALAGNDSVLPRRQRPAQRCARQ